MKAITITALSLCLALSACKKNECYTCFTNDAGVHTKFNYDVCGEENRDIFEDASPKNYCVQE